MRKTFHISHGLMALKAIVKCKHTHTQIDVNTHTHKDTMRIYPPVFSLSISR